MSDWYILVDKVPVKVEMLEYCAWSMNRDNITVEKTEIGDVLVSTVFLGLDHRFSSNNTGPPIVFETLVFGGKIDGEMERYSSWNEAVIGHKEMCNMVLETFSIEPNGLQNLIIESLN